MVPFSKRGVRQLLISVLILGVGPCDCSVRWIFDDNAILINYLWTGQCERPDLGWVDVQYLPPSYFVDCFDEALS